MRDEASTGVRKILTSGLPLVMSILNRPQQADEFFLLISFNSDNLSRQKQTGKLIH